MKALSVVTYLSARPDMSAIRIIYAASVGTLVVVIFRHLTKHTTRS